MTEFISRFLRTAAFAALALLGMAMALVFMISTAIAVGVLYVVARLRGKPFGIRAYWAQRSQAYNFGAAPFRSAAAGDAQGGQPADGGRARPARPAKPRAADVIDVEVREVN